MDVWVLLMRLSHCQRARSEVFAVKGDEQSRSKALFPAVLNGTSMSDPEPVNFSCDPEHWVYGRILGSTAKDITSARISFSTRASFVPLLDWLPASEARDLCNPEIRDALDDDSSFIAVTQQHWRACFRRMLRCKLACRLPPSSLHRRSAP